MYTNCALTVKQLLYKPEEGEVGGAGGDRREGGVDGGRWGGGAAFYTTFMDGLC